MRKFSLTDQQMITAEAMEAKGLSSELLRWETRGPGDTDNAMRRIARRYGIEYSALWSIRYRSPKRIYADVLTAIKAAHAAETMRQLRKLAHDAELTEAVAGPNLNSVAQALALLRQAESDLAPMVDGERQ